MMLFDVYLFYFDFSLGIMQIYIEVVTTYDRMNVIGQDIEGLKNAAK